ncbi:hypothetical protein RHGRI_032786 [Rhododendron griersonianum]|uniref:At3g05675-like ankyrin-like domain-containing protein n=1 Tax=Rhododendron griersonianum TaxID=479676 RepID=A0AAV6IFG0_9ERIC|nr:hypothetical protein RHGRI_032786 [Rhododendron griersonianum]
MMGNHTGGAGGPKKRQRVNSSSRLSSTAAVIDSSRPDITLTEASHKPAPATLRRSASHSSLPTPSSSTSRGGFNDAATADVILRLYLEKTPSPFDSSPDDSESISAVDSVDKPDVQVYLHSHVLARSKYFAALLSDRWQRENYDSNNNTNTEADCESSDKKIHRFNFGVAAVTGSIDNHLTVLQLLYTNDFSNAIDSVSTALYILPVALELLFEDCVRSCVRFLEAVPWTEEEERRVVSLIPFLSEEESKELLSRVSPFRNELGEEMLYGLILTAIHNYNQLNMAFAKAFESARRVLDRAFEMSLKVVKESLEEYSSPEFRGDHKETEAIQRLNLHTAMTNGRHLVWLVERMIELRVADMAVKEWSELSAFTADLQRAFRDDAWRNIVPALPAVVMRTTAKLANAIVAGHILAPRQVRMKLVKDWLPVLIVCKENVSPIMPNQKLLYVELEESFLKIISTLPMPDAQELLQQCLSFSTRNVDDCPHLVNAFNTWFRRANRPQHSENPGD